MHKNSETYKSAMIEMNNIISESWHFSLKEREEFLFQQFLQLTDNQTIVDFKINGFEIYFKFRFFTEIETLVDIKTQREQKLNRILNDKS